MHKKNNQKLKKIIWIIQFKKFSNNKMINKYRIYKKNQINKILWKLINN